MAKKKGERRDDPVIENRKARHDYHIGETLECGIKLLGTEVKSVRDGQMSLGEGWVRGELEPPSLTLMQVHIGEYLPAGRAQHPSTRQRVLLAKRREIRKITEEANAKGGTIVPLKVYFVRGVAKLLVGVGVGKNKVDKRQDLAKRTHQREIDRATSRRRL
ncbi:MAG: SsrA-binding protein SmpB [Phycisphaerae bacterium]|jgi:SsrA-binding protein|nr:SsrA-binding protein SmpB [Phycisphaerae bacterium]